MATVAAPQDPQKDATKPPSELFRYSTWVHVGLGAEECEEAETGTCGNPLHFHAWCRLPNQLQHEDIRERALAAKARRLRQLRDPETDAYAVLEGDMSELLRVADPEQIITELVNKDWWKRQLEAMRDVEEQEEFATADRDRERLAELQQMDPDKVPADELAELERHLQRYTDAVDARRREMDEPIRAALGELTKDQLVGEIREERIAAEAASAFMESYSRWEWLAGTFTSASPTDRRRAFTDINQLTDAAPEVLAALQGAFSELESSLQRGAAGN